MIFIGLLCYHNLFYHLKVRFNDMLAPSRVRLDTVSTDPAASVFTSGTDHLLESEGLKEVGGQGGVVATDHQVRSPREENTAAEEEYVVEMRVPRRSASCAQRR